jgi:hypothetical protein
MKQWHPQMVGAAGPRFSSKNTSQEIENKTGLRLAARSNRRRKKKRHSITDARPLNNE